MVSAVSRPATVLLLLVVVLAAAANAFLPAPTAAAAPVDPRLAAAAAAAPAADLDALVSVDGDVRAVLAPLRALGLDVLRVYPDFGVVYVAGPAMRVLAAAQVRGVSLVEANAPLPLAMETAAVATNARAAWDDRLTSTTPVVVGGDVIDGRGVGVAVVDTGIDGTHPDLMPAIGANKRWACTTPGVYEASTGYRKCFGTYIGSSTSASCTDAAWRDVTMGDQVGHGTHVAGIVAGRGVASDGRFQGAAPGATVYGLGAAEGHLVVWALEAFQWVLCNHASVTPAIRVVSNSWGGPGAFDPNAAINKAANALVAAGLVVVYAAGNDGAGGQVSTWSKNPTPGVISVANYDDGENGTRAGTIDATSSACKATDPASECPDVAAPGTNIVAASSKVGALPGPGTALVYAPYYSYATGTSMAAPHVAGIVALLLQANPALTPAQIEDILEDTAVRFPSAAPYATTDPSNGGAGVSITAGHGLVDAVAALADPRVAAGGGSSLARVATDPHVYMPNIDLQFASGLRWTAPTGVEVILAERALASGDAVGWPLASGQTCRFVILPPAGPSQSLGCALAADGASAFRMEATHTFTQAGAHRVEPQIDFGGGFVSIDAFVVRVVQG